VSETTIQLILSDTFLTGFIVGLLVTLAAMVWTAITSSPFPAGGLLLAATALAVLAVTLAVDVWLALGLVLLAVAGLIRTRTTISAIAIAIPGGIVIGISFLDSTLAALPGFVVLAIAVLAPLVASFDERNAQSTVATPLIAISFAGVLLTIPDTKEALVVASVAAAWVLAGPPARAARLGRSGAYAATGLLVWVVASGGFARPGSLIAGVAVLGLLIAEPVGRLVRTARPTRLDRLTTKGVFSALWVPAAQAGLVLAISQSVKFSGSNAALALAIVLPLLALAAWWAGRPEPGRIRSK